MELFHVHHHVANTAFSQGQLTTMDSLLVGPDDHGKMPGGFVYPFPLENGPGMHPGFYQKLKKNFPKKIFG